MINRRDFIEASALAAVPLALGTSALSYATSSGPLALPGADLQRVVFDTRFADSVAFANEAGRLNLATAAISGDITGLWYDDLYHLWKAGPAAIAGMTTEDALFCLETLGNDAGLRLVMRAEHRVSAACVEHTLNGSQALSQGAALDQAGGQWSAQMAQLLKACPATRMGRSQATAVSQTRTVGANPLALVSWVLAPLPRRASFSI